MKTESAVKRIERYFLDRNYSKLKKFCRKYAKDLPLLRFEAEKAEKMLQVFSETDFYVGIELLNESSFNLSSLHNFRGENLLHVVCKAALNDEKKFSSLVVPLVRLLPQLLSQSSKCGVTAIQLVDHLEQMKPSTTGSQETTDERCWREKLGTEADNEHFFKEGKYENLSSFSETQFETYSSWSDRIGKEYHEKIRKKDPAETKRISHLQKPKSQSSYDSANRIKLSQTFLTKAKVNSTLRLQKLYMKYQQGLRIQEMRRNSILKEEIENCQFQKIYFPGVHDPALDFKIIKSYVESKKDPQEAKKILKKELVRWHPDKLKQKYKLCSTDDSSSERILKRAVELFQNIDALYKTL